MKINVANLIFPFIILRKMLNRPLDGSTCQEARVLVVS